MYESPIEILVGKIQTKMEDDLVKAVQSYHINVDKDELIKALRYDRDQYEKGYDDCRRSFLTKHGKWVREFPNYSRCEFICSICGGNALYEYESWGQTKSKYCPHCGAMMEDRTDADTD